MNKMAASNVSRILPRIYILYRQVPFTRRTDALGPVQTHSHPLTDPFKHLLASVHSSASCCAGSRWREENNLPRSGNEYGPLTDRPDWSYADGRPGPPSSGALRRREKQRELAMRIDELASQLIAAKENYRRSVQSKAEDEMERRRRQLKPKGDFISNLSPNRNKARRRRKQRVAIE